MISRQILQISIIPCENVGDFVPKPTIVWDWEIYMGVCRSCNLTNLAIFKFMRSCLLFISLFSSCLCLTIWVGECIPRAISQSSKWMRKREKIKMGSPCLGSLVFYVLHAFQHPYSTLSLHIPAQLTFPSTHKNHKTEPLISLYNSSLHCLCHWFLPLCYASISIFDVIHWINLVTVKIRYPLSYDLHSV